MGLGLGGEWPGEDDRAKRLDQGCRAWIRFRAGEVGPTEADKLLESRDLREVGLSPVTHAGTP